MRLRSSALMSAVIGLLTIPGVGSAARVGAGPSIIVNGDPPTTFQPVATDTFGFGSDVNGGGDFGFTNNTGQAWTRLDVFFTLTAGAKISCDSSVFSACTIEMVSPAGTAPVSYDAIFGPDLAGGVLTGENFTINLNNDGNTNTDPNGSGAWPADTDFTAVVNAPEPRSVLLGGAGLVFLCGYFVFFAGFTRKRFSKAAN